MVGNSNFSIREFKGSLLKDASPSLYQDLHPTKNPLPHNEIKVDSTSLVWWVCELGHEWKSTTYNRVVRESGCPYCQGRKVLAGFNDITTTHPELNKEWNDSRDASLFSAGSGKKVSWKCNKNHTWEATINSRKKGSGCPYCSGKRILKGVNDLATVYPELVAEWDESSPASSFAPSSKRKVQWICQRGHTWKAQVNSRTTGNQGCPYCHGMKVLSGFNDLATTHPEAVEEWYDERNIKTVKAGSNYIAQWLCLEAGHAYKMSVYKKTHLKKKCPYCYGRKVLQGFNDLETQFPHLVEEWNDEKRPFDSVSTGIGYKASWRCSKGHTWKATLNDRTRKDSPRGCPKCSPNVSKSEQELADYVFTALGEDANVIQSSRALIPPYEVDIYIPEKSVAIEFNGIYWHTESSGKDKWYHYEKWKRCRNLDIQLITIWEDNWNNSRNLIERMLLRKLGVSTERRVPARKTEAAIVSTAEASSLYSSHHVQGHADGMHIGLREKHTGEIIAVSTWRRMNSSQEVRLDRFAASCIVQGGFSKLLKHASHKFAEEGFKKIVTFADHEVSDGGLYEKHGFIADRKLDPDYKYLYGGERQHKFGFRLKRFKNSPELEYVENMTEKKLAELNGLERVWDCGKTRYVLPLQD